MSKYAITSGTIAAPVKTVLYGPEGIGKALLPPSSPPRYSLTPRAAPSG